jgi:3D (Asp-Asp-Asp) domain-containing protein
MRRIKAVIFIITCVLFAAVAWPTGMFNFNAADTALNQVTVYDQGVPRNYRSSALTVEGFMWEYGIEVNDLDRVSHSMQSVLWDGMIITLERELEFSVQVDNEPAFTRVTRPDTTVGQVLSQVQAEQNIALVFSGNLERPIARGEILVFNTWRLRTQTDSLVLPYETLENHTGSVRAGRSYVRQVGVPGQQELTSSIVYIGGSESNREIIDTVILSEPIEAIIDIGTAQLGELADPTAPDFHYVRHLRMEATAYTAGFNCTGKHPDDPWYRITASGREVQHGIVAVDRTVIPLGTRLYVAGYGFALAADVGGAIRGYKIDLFMECINDARRFGRRHIDVWILD